MADETPKWEAIPLNNLTEHETPITYGVVKPGGEGDVPFVRGGDIAGGRVLMHQLRTIDCDVSKQYRRTLLRGGEILVSLVGNPGQIAIAPASLAGANIARQVGLVRLKPGIDTRFVSYFLQSHEGQASLGTQSLGSVQQVINLRDLKTVKIPLPSLAEQEAIAEILGALDDKIELNRQMSVTLEAMAMALFQSWFVDFDPVRAKLDGCESVGVDATTAALFPAHFQASELGHIPQGWRVGKVGDLATLVRDAVNPGDFPMEPFDHFSLPAFDNGRIPKTELGRTIMSNKFIVVPNSVLLSKLNPHIPRIWLPDIHASRRSICSTEFMVTCPNPGVTREFLFSLFTSSTFTSIYGTLVTGTTGSHQRVRPEGTVDMKVVAPPGALIRAFTDIVKPLFDRINGNIMHSFTLATLRDTLLPKLLSGELRPPQI